MDNRSRTGLYSSHRTSPYATRPTPDVTAHHQVTAQANVECVITVSQYMGASLALQSCKTCGANNGWGARCTARVENEDAPPQPYAFCFPERQQVSLLHRQLVTQIIRSIPPYQLHLARLHATISAWLLLLLLAPASPSLRSDFANVSSPPANSNRATQIHTTLLRGRQMPLRLRHPASWTSLKYA